TSRQLCVRARPDLDLVAVGKIDRGIENHLVAVLDAGAYLDGRTEVAHHSYGVDARDTVRDHRDTEALPVEDDRLGWDDQRRRLARDLQFDGAIGSRR